MDKQYTDVLHKLQEKNGFDKAFTCLSEAVATEINASLQKDERVLILASDVDSIGCSTIIWYLMKN